MIYSSGIDIVEIGRIKKILAKHRDKFINKIINIDNETLPKEITCTFLASRFAAKEAFVKAVGLGFREPFSYKKIWIRSNDYGKPYICLDSKLNQYLEDHEIKHIHLSISHEKKYAIANVILEN
mgnify:CR=1 FL=1